MWGQPRPSMHRARAGDTTHRARIMAVKHIPILIACAPWRYQTPMIGKAGIGLFSSFDIAAVLYTGDPNLRPSYSNLSIFKHPCLSHAPLAPLARLGFRGSDTVLIRTRCFDDSMAFFSAPRDGSSRAGHQPSPT